MAIYLEKIRINSYRGISDLSIDGLNHVNLIVGDNNCGKTSALESVLLLRAPSELSNLLRISRIREYGFYRPSEYECFINMFSKESKEKKIEVAGIVNKKRLSCKVEGKITKVLLDPDDNRMFFWAGSFQNGTARNSLSEDEANAFIGRVLFSTFNKTGSEEVIFSEYSSAAGMQIGTKDLLKINYFSPFSYLDEKIIGHILKDEEYKRECLENIKLFDPEIDDFSVARDEETGRLVEYIHHKRMGNMPVSTYGDGIKKVLSLSAAISKTKDGILLIDEIETSIHSKHYASVFSFLLRAAKQFDVQLFITTHSIEALDCILELQRYEESRTCDMISVITLKKEENRTYSRVLTGKRTFEDRENFGFEVRL